MASTILTGPAQVTGSAQTYVKAIASPDPSRDGVRFFNPSRFPLRIVVVATGAPTPPYTSAPFKTIAAGEAAAVNISPDYDIYVATEKGDLNATVWEGQGEDFFSGGGGGISDASIPVRDSQLLLPSQVTEYDMIYGVRPDGTPYKMRWGDVSTMLGTTGNGFDPGDLGDLAMAFVPDAENLWLNTGLSTPMLANGTNEQVAGWTDGSGNSHHATQGTGANRPLWRSSDLTPAGFNYIKVPGNSTGMGIASPLAFGTVWTFTGIYNIPAASFGGSATLDMIVSTFSGNNTNGGCSLGFDEGGRPWLRKAAGFGEGITGGVAAADAWFTATWRYDTSTSPGLRFWLNDVELTGMTNVIHSNNFAGITPGLFSGGDEGCRSNAHFFGGGWFFNALKSVSEIENQLIPYATQRWKAA